MMGDRRVPSRCVRTATALAALVLLAGCTSPGPEPTQSHPSSTTTQTAAPTAQPAAVPDLAELCEQLLPLATVQERFGQDIVLAATAASARPQIAEWSTAARGDLFCQWRTAQPASGTAAVEIITRRGGAGSIHASAKERIASWSSQPDQGGVDAALDRFGDSVDACTVDRCEYSVLTARGSWLWAAFQAPPRADPAVEQLRAAADGDLERLTAEIDDILREIDVPRRAVPSCDDLITLEQARGLVGDGALEPIDALESSGWNPTILSDGPAALVVLERCDRVDPADLQGISVRYAAVPQSVRDAAFDSVVENVIGDSTDARSGERIEIAGAEAAWRFCFDDGGCGVDVLAQGVWMQIHARDSLLVPAAETIVANLTD